MKSNRKKLTELFTALTKSTTIGGTKFRYGVLKNLRIIDLEIETLKGLEKDLQAILTEYTDARNSIIKKYGKEENGIISVNKDSENYGQTMVELNELGITYKEDINKYNEKAKEYEELLNEEYDFDFNLFEISLDNIPDEFKELNILMDFEIVK